MEEEAHLEVCGGGERRWSGVGEELEGHGAGVVWNAEEIVGAVEGGDGGQVGEAEEGLEAGVGAELDVEFGVVGWRCDCGVEGLEDL